MSSRLNIRKCLFINFTTARFLLLVARHPRALYIEQPNMVTASTKLLPKLRYEEGFLIDLAEFLHAYLTIIPVDQNIRTSCEAKYFRESIDQTAGLTQFDTMAFTKAVQLAYP